MFFFYFWLFEKKSRLKKENGKQYRKENKNYIQQGRIEVTLKEHPGRADLEVPHYSPDGQSSREMALSIGIDFERFPIFRILNFHCTIWVNYLDDERASPPRTKFSWKHV